MYNVYLSQHSGEEANDMKAVLLLGSVGLVADGGLLQALDQRLGLGDALAPSEEPSAL